MKDSNIEKPRATKRAPRERRPSLYLVPLDLEKQRRKLENQAEWTTRANLAEAVSAAEEAAEWAQSSGKWSAALFLERLRRAIEDIEQATA